MNIIIKKAVETVKTVFVAVDIKSEEEFAAHIAAAFAKDDKAIGKVTFVGNGVCYMKVWHTISEVEAENVVTKTGVSLLLVCKGEYALTKDSKYYIDLSSADVEISESAKNSGEIRAYITGAKIS